MGLGDFKLGAALGFIYGWPDTALILIIAFITGAIVGGLLMVTGRKRMKDKVPFGPFLVAGAVIVFFFGYQIIGGYF